MNEVAWQPGDAAILAGRIASQAGEVNSLVSEARGASVGSNSFGLMISPLVTPITELFLDVMGTAISEAGASCSDLSSALKKVNANFQETESGNISAVQTTGEMANGGAR